MLDIADASTSEQSQFALAAGVSQSEPSNKVRWLAQRYRNEPGQTFVEEVGVDGGS